MKCELQPYSLSDAGLLVFMFNNHGRKTSVVKCDVCGWYHIEENEDDEARKD